MLHWKKGIYVSLAAAALACAASLMSGCGNGGGSSTSGGSPGNLKPQIRVAVNAQPDSYDISRTTATISRTMMLGNVFEMLVSFDENYKVHPELAEKIDVNQDYTEYTYHLRKGVKFHNGQEMKADDVVASMNRWIDGNSQAKAATGGSHFTKQDDYTVTITMPKPSMMLNDMIAGINPAPIIVPKSVIDKADPKTHMITDYIGTGPYMVDEIKPDNYIRLKKFDQYQPYGEQGHVSGWNGYKEAKTASVEFDFVTDPSTRVSGLQSGEYDMAVRLPIDQYSLFKDNKDFLVMKEDVGGIFLDYNKKEGIAANVKLRQAVNAALNDDDILTAAVADKEFYRLTSSYVQMPKNIWYSETGNPWYNQHNADKAKTLLKEANYQGEPFRILVSSSYQEFYNSAVVIKQELNNIGVNVELNVVDWGTFLGTRRDPSKYDAFITGVPISVVPNQILYLSSTWDGWSNDPHLQDTLKQMAEATDQKAAVAMWNDLQKYCWEEYLPISKFGDYYTLDAASSKVKDMDFFEGPHMWNLTVES
jgi:peptide/nickel transport system substrate-binding protein